LHRTDAEDDLLVLVYIPPCGVAISAAAIRGLGYGCFLSVDKALATRVLPDAQSRKKDLGVMTIATAVPHARGSSADCWLPPFLVRSPCC